MTEVKLVKRGGVRQGSGRKPGINKIPKTFKINKDLYAEFESVNKNEKTIDKLEEAIRLYISKYTN